MRAFAPSSSSSAAAAANVEVEDDWLSRHDEFIPKMNFDDGDDTSAKRMPEPNRFDFDGGGLLSSAKNRVPRDIVEGARALLSYEGFFFDDTTNGFAIRSQLEMLAQAQDDLTSTDPMVAATFAVDTGCCVIRYYEPMLLSVFLMLRALNATFEAKPTPASNAKRLWWRDVTVKPYKRIEDELNPPMRGMTFNSTECLRQALEGGGMEGVVDDFPVQVEEFLRQQGELTPEEACSDDALERMLEQIKKIASGSLQPLRREVSAFGSSSAKRQRAY